jgi:hypothetical protein
MLGKTTPVSLIQTMVYKSGQYQLQAPTKLIATELKEVMAVLAALVLLDAVQE